MFTDWQKKKKRFVKTNREQLLPMLAKHMSVKMPGCMVGGELEDWQQVFPSGWEKLKAGMTQDNC